MFVSDVPSDLCSSDRNGSGYIKSETKSHISKQNALTNMRSSQRDINLRDVKNKVMLKAIKLYSKQNDNLVYNCFYHCEKRHSSCSELRQIREKLKCDKNRLLFFLLLCAT